MKTLPKNGTRALKAIKTEPNKLKWGKTGGGTKKILPATNVMPISKNTAGKSSTKTVSKLKGGSTKKTSSGKKLASKSTMVKKNVGSPMVPVGTAAPTKLAKGGKKSQGFRSPYNQ